MASRRCGKRQTGSFKDGHRASPPPLQADGALNPQRLLKAMHDRGGRLFCRHRQTCSRVHTRGGDTQAHVLSLSVHPSVSRGRRSLLLLPVRRHRRSHARRLGFLPSSLRITWLPCRHFSSIIFLPHSGPVTLINLRSIMETRLMRRETVLQLFIHCYGEEEHCKTLNFLPHCSSLFYTSKPWMQLGNIDVCILT